MGSKAARKVPDVLLRWLDKNVSPEFAKWYAKNSRAGARQVTTERQRMSAEAGTVGAYHEGHFRGAKDVDPKLGGGPTTGLTMRPEIGVVNVAHAEAPRIPYEDMRKAGIPQNWIEDVFETVLESEGLGVIGNLDTKAAMDIDAGNVTPGQAMAQTDRRQQLRAQGVDVGPDTSVKFKPFEGDIQVKPDARLPNLTEGLAQELNKEQLQIANRRSNKPKVRVKGGAAQLLGIPFLAGGIAAGTTLLQGGSPAQAASNFAQAENPIEDLDAGPLFNEDAGDYGDQLQQAQIQNARPLEDRLNEGVIGDVGRAVKRGPRWSIQAGSFKIDIPEFGYSELLGINK